MSSRIITQEEMFANYDNLLDYAWFHHRHEQFERLVVAEIRLTFLTKYNFQQIHCHFTLS